MQISIREWVSKWNNGEFSSKDFDTQVKAGWYDWFCSDSSLSNKLVKFGKILAKVTNDFVLDSYYVWFKNNCPMVGRLYDDVRFEPLNGDLRDSLYFGIAVDDERNKAKYTVFTARNEYKDEFNFSKSSEVVTFLNDWKG